jgi:hypothetical protein
MIVNSFLFTSMAPRARRSLAGLVISAAVILASSYALAGPQLTESPGPDDIALVSDGTAIPIYVEPHEDRAVKRAAGDLAEDIARVTGIKPALTENPSDAKAELIILGTLGKNKTLERLVADGKLDVTGVRGQWESHVSQVVKNPVPGVDKALVIAGSDRRGAIFGIYELSEAIGVSPWYWWADVPVKSKKLLAVRAGVSQQGPPAVKYRGIFLNDEDWCLRPWAAKTLEPETGNIGPKTYAKIFELLLRLKSNFLWPAMHDGTPAFNTFPTNKDIADLYGIVMGSSHCEQMLRDNVDEWHRDGQGEYNYVVNRDGVLKYWETRVRENGKFDNIYTMGMRGIHDSGMPGGGTQQEQAERLHRIIEDQRELLRKWVNPDVTKVPQIFCPYKEVLALYRLAPDIPEDITLCWPDDNYGYVRQFSDAREQQRSGGAGVYYHVSYWGTPYDYLWLCSTPPALVWEELTKAWDYGARTLWVINVGDLKPAEIDIEFALRLGWNPHQWQPDNANHFLEEMFTRDFGPEHAREMASILSEYFQLNFQRKPEHMGLDERNPLLAKPVYSIMVNGDEAARRVDAFAALAERAGALGKHLSASQRDAYFQLVAYPVRGAALMNSKGLNLARFRAYADQGRASAADYLAKAQQAYDDIQRETDGYNNLANGKWRNMMSASPRNQGVFRRPEGTPPAVPDAAILGVALEGVDKPQLAGSNVTVALPQFSKFTRQQYFADVFNSGRRPVHWTAAASADWILLSRTEGTQDQRVWVSVDWAKAPTGEDVRETIRFAGAGQEIPVEVSLFNPANTAAMSGVDFVEDNRRVVMEAAHASALSPGKDAKWETVRGLGYNGESISVFPTTVAVRLEPDRIRAESPCAQYRVWVQHAGDWKITVRALPTFSVEAGKPQRYAIALDDEPPGIVSLPVAASEQNRQWQENVLRSAALAASTHTIARSGVHTLKIWMVDPGIVLDTILADVGSTEPLGYTWPTETRVVRTAGKQ